MHRHQFCLKIFALFTTLLALSLGAGPAQAEDGTGVQSAPATLSIELQDVRDGQWKKAVDTSSGTTLLARAVITLPTEEEVSWEGAHLLWLRGETSEGVVLNLGELHAYLLHADGGTSEVSLEASSEASRFTIGTNDLAAAAGGIRGQEQLIIEIPVMLEANHCSFGLDAGNSIKAELEYTQSAAYAVVGRTLPDEAKLYTYQARIQVKDAEENGGRSMAGFELALRDAAGRYLCAGGSWQDTPDGAAIHITDESGHLYLLGVNSGRYELVDLRAKDESKAVLGEPVPLELQVSGLNEQEASFVATIPDERGRVVSVDPAFGLVVIELEGVEAESDAISHILGWGISNLILCSLLAAALLVLLIAAIIVLRRG